MTFEECVEIILKWEGEYSNHPDDSGGETKFGISKKAYPLLDIKNLNRKHAISIYRQDYYFAVGGDAIPEEVRLVILSSAVNQGVSFALRAIQSILKVKVDGRLGPKTLEALSKAEPVELKREFLRRQVEQYFSLKKPVFLKGWILRVVDTACY